MNALVGWNQHTDTSVTGYHVFHGYRPNDYFETVTVNGRATVSYNFTGLDDFKTHYFSVTAFTAAALESGLSAEVSKRLPHPFTLRY